MKPENRRSVPAWAAASWDECEPGFFTRMLIEDVGNRRYHWKPSVEFDPRSEPFSSDTLAELLREFNLYGSRSAVDSVLDFVEHVSEAMALCGAAFVEPFRDPESGEIVLGNVPHWSLRRRGSRWVQRSRAFDPESGFDLPDSTPIETDITGGMWEVRLGRGMRRAASRAVDHLAARDRAHAAEIRMRETPGYERSEHQRILNLRSARETAAIGWGGRGLFLDASTSGYKALREIRFAGFCATLAYEALAVLNRVTDNVDFFGGSTFRVRLNGIPTAEECVRLERAFVAGELPVDEARRRLTPNSP